MLQEIVDELYGSRPRKPLYHYTSLHGLMGIVGAKILWASEIHYLNDAKELRHFADQLNREIARRMEQEHARTEMLRQFRDWLPSRISQGPMMFVASFTENGNLLSQWRGYCPHGKGVSIGFEPSSLIAAAAQASFSIGRCVYDSAAQASIAGGVVDTIVELAKKWEPSPKYHVSQSWYGLFESIEPTLLRIAALIKSGSFQEEQEWRVVSPTIVNYIEPPIKYREGISTLVPYLEVPLPTKRNIESESLAICHTFVGPTPSPNLSINSVSKYLSQAGVKPNLVSNSGIAYRQT